LYGDYYSVVGFYLRRMELIRHFGVEGRMPLLDYRLVEYAARIPSELKIGKNGETKVILHKVMQGELPDEIVFRKDKLGHSVPMKNWMRESAPIQTLLKEYLSSEIVRRRGFFDPVVISRMMLEHQKKSHNHSHRLWSLLVLELWCRAHLNA
jgi:asparagine synthase (glutamine-hydrolysing)